MRSRLLVALAAAAVLTAGPLASADVRSAEAQPDAGAGRVVGKVADVVSSAVAARGVPPEPEISAAGEPSAGDRDEAGPGQDGEGYDSDSGSVADAGRGHDAEHGKDDERGGDAEHGKDDPVLEEPLPLQVSMASDPATGVSLSGGVRLDIGLPAGGRRAVNEPGVELGIYPGVDNGVSSAVQVDASAVSIYAVLWKTPTRPEIPYPLNLHGAVLEPTDAGGYELVRDGQVEATLQPPWAEDADGDEVPTSYRLDGRTLVQELDLRDASYPVVADPRIENYKRFTKTFQGKKLNTRGYIPDDCLDKAIACKGMAKKHKGDLFRPECTAQAHAIRALSATRMNGFQRHVLAWRVADDVQWEVGPYSDSSRVQDEVECDGGRQWRIDIVTDSRKIIEVKRWTGPKTARIVRDELRLYRALALGRGIQFNNEDELTRSEWAWCYGDGDVLDRDEQWCAWAGDAGHVYFARRDKLSADLKTKIEARYRDTQKWVAGLSMAKWLEAVWKGRSDIPSKVKPYLVSPVPEPTPGDVIIDLCRNNPDSCLGAN